MMRSTICLLVVLVGLFSCEFALAQNTNVIGSGLVSRPVGVVVLVIPPNSEAVLAVPFDPFDPALSTVLQGQMTAATNDAKGDLVRFWDADSGSYRAYEKVGLTEWRLVPTAPDGTNAVSSDQEEPTIEPGSGFTVVNHQSVPQRLMFGGLLVLDSLRTVKLSGGVSLVAYPFTSAKPAAETDIGQADGTLTGDAFQMAVGYWHILTNSMEATWNEPRPYESPFSTNNEVQITGLICDAKKNEVTLSVEAQGNTSRTVDIFKRDMAPSDQVCNWRGWTLVATNLPVEGGKALSWTDQTLGTDPAFKGVRFYLTARSDTRADLDCDGVPDPRAWLCAGTDQEDGQTDLSTNDDMTITTGEGDSASSTNGLAETNAPSSVALSKDWVHVDIRNGDDSFTGFLVTNSVDDGPKRTIMAGLEVVPAGGTMVIHEGTYYEDLHAAGKPIRIRVDGKVRLHSNGATQGTGGAATGP